MYSLYRLLLPSYNSCGVLLSRHHYYSFRRLLSSVFAGRYATDQLEYVNEMIEKNKDLEWSTLRESTLKIPGSLNQKNIDGVLLKKFVNCKKFDVALSFAKYLESNEDFSLGSINGLLTLYYEMGKEKELTAEQRSFILQTYKNLYSKYKVLDSTTGECLLHALCVINEWKKALKVLDDIQLSNKPSHSAYSSLITLFFNLNMKAEALRLIERSVNNNRPLQSNVYEAWIDYVLRKYKENKTKLKHLDDVCLHIFNNTAPIRKDGAVKFIETYNTLGWVGTFTRIKKIDGMCASCGEKLDCLKLTEDEFTNLQRNVKDKLIVGSDLFLKTLPEELDRFLKFFKKTAPYDVVLDALNIAYIARNGNLQKVDILKAVVNYFADRNKKVLLLGRKHMLQWPRKEMEVIKSKTSSFFIDNLSQDDPYFITAAILSGSHTDFVSKDLLRGHKFVLKDDNLRLIFRRWQWQHQWMVHINKHTKIVIRPPLSFTPCAQRNNGAWHIPIEVEGEDSKPSMINDGTPNLSNWICLRPPKLNI